MFFTARRETVALVVLTLVCSCSDQSSGTSDDGNSTDGNSTDDIPIGTSSGNPSTDTLGGTPTVHDSAPGTSPNAPLPNPSDTAPLPNTDAGVGSQTPPTDTTAADTSEPGPRDDSGPTPTRSGDDSWASGDAGAMTSNDVRPGDDASVASPDAGCMELVTNSTLAWRDSSLQTDQEIVECLAHSLGRAVGYGEKALGGYDPGGASKLVIIRKNASSSVEAQLAEALSGDDHAWIVFDKGDFADDVEVAMYRLYCADAAVLEHLQATEAECLDYRSWCDNRGQGGENECLEQFFNVALNEGDLPIRNPVIGSNKTLDGRMSNAFFRFSGFALGADSSGEPTQTSSNVILTHLSFRGAGHTEDHELDPDMIRSTGASHDIWIHKNDFDLTGDSAFDVKVGAHAITMSFNRVVDVKRASLHGSSDSRTINEQITTTMHHNAFVTRDSLYETFGNTGRRVPLIRRGKSHMWNNLFVNYRKEVLSIRVEAQVLWQDNALVVNEAHQEKDSLDASLDDLASNLFRDIDGGSFRAEGTLLWYADATCTLNAASRSALTPASGTVADLALEYSEASRATITAYRQTAEQALVDYVSATAGKHGQRPFNSPLSASVEEVLAQGKVPCQ